MTSPYAALSKTSPDAAEVTVSVSQSFESASVGREEWDQFVRDVGGELYVTFDWCRIWWRHYGQQRSLRLYTFREGSRLVGLAPMFIERVRLGPVSLKIAKRVGADFAMTVFALPLAADYVEIAYGELITRLIEGENCDAIWFGFMPGNDPTIGGLRQACRSLKELMIVARDAPAGPHTLFRLPDSFEAYLAGLDSRQRQNFQRRFKLLKKSYKVESDTVQYSSEAEGAFADFKALHDNQWKAQGKLGHFGDWPGSELFNKELVSALSQLGRLRVVRLIADQRVLSYQYTFIFGDCCYWRLTARGAEREWDRFGLGILGLVHLIEAMTKEGVRRIEAGIGHYDYKLQFGGEEFETRSIVVVTPGAALRTRIFLKLSEYFHFAYYRVWYLRLAPRLGLMRWPLWPSWIRCRL
jgi:CelD/BcsL family acetyltransferase involved in cellulose biosynthesis